MADLKEFSSNFFTADVTLVTTAETVIVVSNPIIAPYPFDRILVAAWAQLATGATTSAVTPRIRRGTLATDPLVGEGNSEGVKITAPATEPFFILVQEDRLAQDTVQYVFTLQQTGATANGAALQGGILVWVT